MQNDMRDKLVEILQSKIAPWEYLLCKENIKALADYLIENGVIIPPCNVGDTVYEFFDVRGFYDISEWIVENVVVSVNPLHFGLRCKVKDGKSQKTWGSDDFGKTLFFTREQAEQKKQERLSE